MTDRNQLELSLIACKNYYKSKMRDAFLLEIGRLQIRAEIHQHIKEDERYKELMQIFDNMMVSDSRKYHLSNHLARDISSQSFSDFYSSLENDIVNGNDKELEKKVSRHFSYLLEWEY